MKGVTTFNPGTYLQFLAEKDLNDTAIEAVLMTIHGVVGTCVVISGISALISRKGSDFHRSSGILFALSLCVMAVIILITAFMAPHLISTLGITFTALACYMVLSSWETVRQRPATLSRLGYIAPVVASSVGILALYWGSMAASGYQEVDDDVPVAAYFVFGGLAFLSAGGDVSTILKGGAVGAQRLARHLWRMCFGLYLFTSGLFTGSGSVVFPEQIRGSWVLMIPELSVLILSIYWLNRVFWKQKVKT
jgi:hypothetical protein